MTVKNNPNVSGWSLDSGYSYPWGIDNNTYPIQAANYKLLNFVQFFVEMYPNDYEHKCSGLEQGLKIVLSTPGEALRMSQNYFRITESENIKMYPEMIEVTKKLRHYQPNQRKCFYSDERRLRFFKMYTEINCEEECLANFTKTMCGCVKFSMPRDVNTKICGGAKMKCLSDARKIFWATNSGKTVRDQCNCLPGCTIIKYNPVIDRPKQDLKTSPSYDSKKDPHIPLFFKIRSGEGYVKKSTRIELYSVPDFLAICGGLLGFFVGASVLSIIELIYFSTLHLFWKIRCTPSANAVATSNGDVENIASTSNQNMYIEDIELS
ncbi:pickpocket protein 28-like [Contarinia nasturtii]|uniref:pickpocket protein 28-like n=1 Tax=Contarinia nasturtii TaxID=265458 RepID=UPI0012D3B1F8|nr:pickpocket protein 28-like [Contarinia nasturtii]XP_031637711.1 pickpocket protein 28-like [Contarinia nasturtii]